MYILCDSITGYILKLKLHSKTEKLNEIIFNLTHDYKFKNHHLYMDNLYNSVSTTKELLKVGIYSCGTLRQNRGTSKEFEEKIKELKPKEIIYDIYSDYICGAFFDKKLIRFVSSIHNPINVSRIDKKKSTKTENGEKIVNWHMAEGEMPLALKEYNKFMGGVDLADQMTKYYSLLRKSNTWIKKYTFYLIDLTIYNSYVLFKMVYSEAKYTLLDFREEIAWELIHFDKNTWFSEILDLKK